MHRPLALLALLLVLPAHAAETARDVLPAGQGPQRLELDAAVISASARADLGDLRLADQAGREVPYLLVQPAAPEGRWLAARLAPVPATRKESGVEADLGAVQAVERVRLSGLPEPFLKRFRLEASGDRIRWTTLVAEGTLFALPAEALRLLEVEFTRGDYRYLRVTWDDRMSARLPHPARLEAFHPEPAPPSPVPLRVPLAVERRPSEPGVSRFALRLPGPRLPVRAIVVDVPGERLHRPARVTEARLGAERLDPVALGEATLQRVTRDGAGAEALRIPVERPEELELELSVDDGDNGPLALSGAAAELAPLPWLYLESPDGAPLVLRAGSTERAAPRYDLEAARPGLATARPALARLSAHPERGAREAGPQSKDVEAPGAPVDTSAFRYARTVAGAAPGLCALPLDAVVLGRTRGLADLRLVGPDGRQVPFILESREAPLVVELPALAPAPSPRHGVTGYALELPEPALPPSRLVLTTSSRVFERRVRVVEDHPRAEGGPRVVAEASWRHADPEHAAAPLTLALAHVGAQRLTVEVDDGDNAALPLAPPRLLLPGWRLRFLHPGPELKLLFGADGVEAPRYDLALLAPRLRAAPAAEVALGPAGPPARPPIVRPATLAWAGLGVGVVAMLWLLARLLRR